MDLKNREVPSGFDLDSLDLLDFANFCEFAGFRSCAACLSESVTVIIFSIVTLSQIWIPLI